jgi:hypothetical protein
MNRSGMTVFFALASALLAQAPRLSVSTLVREDLFAGFLGNDMATFEKGVKTLERLEQEHPDKAGALAWQASAQLYRAVLAHEAKQPQAFRAHYDKAVAMCEQAGLRDTKHIGVLIVCGAAHMIFADRYPEPERRRSAQIGYAAYQKAIEVQSAVYKTFPVHLKGELLVGLAQLAQRTHDAPAMKRYLEEVVTSMPGTVYATRAQRWIDKPEIAPTTTITCLTCHDPGRLKNRLADQPKPAE